MIKKIKYVRICSIICSVSFIIVSIFILWTCHTLAQMEFESPHWIISLAMLIYSIYILVITFYTYNIEKSWVFITIGLSLVMYDILITLCLITSVITRIMAVDAFHESYKSNESMFITNLEKRLHCCGFEDIRENCPMPNQICRPLIENKVNIAANITTVIALLSIFTITTSATLSLGYGSILLRTPGSLS